MIAATCAAGEETCSYQIRSVNSFGQSAYTGPVWVVPFAMTGLGPVTPVGSAPELTDQLYGPVPPVAVQVALPFQTRLPESRATGLRKAPRVG